MSLCDRQAMTVLSPVFDRHELNMNGDGDSDPKQNLLVHLLCHGCPHGPEWSLSSLWRELYTVAECAPSYIDDMFLWRCCLISGVFGRYDEQPQREIMLRSVRSYFDSLTFQATSVGRTFERFETLSKSDLRTLTAAHGLMLPLTSSKEELRTALTDHISRGDCSQAQGDGCTEADRCFRTSLDSNDDCGDMQIYILASLQDRLKGKPLRRLLKHHNIPFNSQDGTAKLRRLLKRHIRMLRKGKRRVHSSPASVSSSITLNERQPSLDDKSRRWPHVVSNRLKNFLLKEFKESTSSAALRTFTCGSCSEEVSVSACEFLPLENIPMDVLRSPKYSEVYLHSISVPVPFEVGPLADLLVDPAGVVYNDVGDVMGINCCRSCNSSLRKGKLPALALANHTYLGPVPPELQDLTVVEECMIARCRAKCEIIHLLEEGGNVILPTAQRGMKGHMIVYPQRPERLVNCLPRTIQDTITPICILFVGSSPPTQQWLREKAKPLYVRREKVRAALVWLKHHNFLYSYICIDEDVIRTLPENDILPVNVQVLPPSRSQDILLSRYDQSQPPAPEDGLISDNQGVPPACVQSPTFDSVVIADVNGRASSNELRAAAIRHIKSKGGGYVEVPHDPSPVNEFNNPTLFPMMYPTLFPYGIGGFQLKKRATGLSMKRHVKHLFSLADRRFQEHYSFYSAHSTSYNGISRCFMLH